MSLPGAVRACALLALVASLSTGCGDDEPNTSTTVTTAATSTAASPSSTVVSAAPSSTTAGTIDGTRVIDVVFSHGRVAGGVRTEVVPLGDKVRLRVTSDVAEEVHVHTYDVMADVAPGQTVELELTATIPGRFEVELEKEGRQLVVLEVR